MADCLHQLISLKMQRADWSAILVWLTSRKHELWCKIISRNIDRTRTSTTHSKCDTCLWAYTWCSYNKRGQSNLVWNTACSRSKHLWLKRKSIGRSLCTYDKNQYFKTTDTAKNNYVPKVPWHRHIWFNWWHTKHIKSWDQPRVSWTIGINLQLSTLISNRQTRSNSV